MSWRINDEEEKRPDLRLIDVFQLPSRRIAKLKVDSKWDKPCDFFRSPLRAQTNLFWREMKIDKMYAEI